MKKIFILILACITVQGFAQTIYETDTFLYNTKVKMYDNGDYYGYFEISSDMVAPEIGSEFEIFSIFSENAIDLDNPQATCKINHLMEGQGISFDINFNSANDVGLIKETGKAIVKIEVKVPVNDYRSILYTIFKNAIYMQDVYEKNHFYWIHNMLGSDSKEKEKKILENMLADIKFTAEAMKKQMKSPSVTGGRFAGTDMFSAMENSTTEDIMSFLRYVELKPRRYQGNTWKFSEIYATWINAGSPSTYDDIVELLFNNFENETNFQKFLKGVEYDSYDILAEYLREHADEATLKEDYKTAIKYIKVIEKIGLDSLSKESIGWHNISYAKIYSAKKELDKAIQKYQIAIEHFTKSETKAGLLVAYNDIANTLNSTNKKANYKKATKYCIKAVDKTTRNIL